ncbi:hydroxyacid dehydrogenase [Radiobacillus sp. PE A8.2]|uniref:hydroxyacid dehydrogenase n=1 Tax=Radiobacillus sp. PE A8.2 TaxID=3380349 RepID=UPI00388E33E3
MDKKIVLLQSKRQINRVFTTKHLDQLRAMGEVVMNGEHRNPDAEKLKELIKDANIAITSWGCPKLTKEILDMAPNLEVVLHAAGTVKGIVTPELWERGIRVSSGSTAMGQGVGETALGMTIASLKDMWRLNESTKNGEWSLGTNIREVYDVTIGVIGAGKAGGHYIKLLQSFDVDVLLYDPIITKAQASAMGAIKVELDELLGKSDVVSIHAPDIPATYKMINQEKLAIMKDDAILINTARGTIIDEDALVSELSKGRLFACIDVTDPEPPAPGHPFRTLPNVVLTPHIAGAITNGLHRLAQYVINEIKLFEAGQQMDGEVKQEDMDVIA